MKAFKAIYSHGHFIDVETQQRLIPVQGEEYTITAKDRAFKTEDTKLLVGVALNSIDKAVWAEKEFGRGTYTKILSADEQLFFRVRNSRRIEGDEDRQYVFVCTLLEDLYLYLLKGKTGDEVEHWRLADCKCVLDSCIHGGLTLSEKVAAKSLNAMFNNTVQFYFSMQRSATTNALNTFFIYKKDMAITEEGIYNKMYKSLGKIRDKFISTRNRG